MKSAAVVLASLVVSLGGVAGCERQPVDSTPLSPAQAPNPNQQPDDAVITTKVKSALMAESDINGSDIAVSTEEGRVTLSGKVPAPQIMRAEAVVRGVEGVVEVINSLTASGDAGGGSS